VRLCKLNKTWKKLKIRFLSSHLIGVFKYKRKHFTKEEFYLKKRILEKRSIVKRERESGEEEIYSLNKILILENHKIIEVI
jgi:hypothetical protein